MEVYAFVGGKIKFVYTMYKINFYMKSGGKNTFTGLTFYLLRDRLSEAQ